MSNFISLDPGIRGCGVAFFESGELRRACYLRNPVRHGDDLDAVAAMSRAIFGRFPYAKSVAAERMQIYAERSEKDPNDLIPLAGISGAVASLVGAGVWYKPFAWKGNIPKGEEFTRRVLSRLSITERSTVEDAGHLSHNVYDAIGIGLFHLGRFAKKRVIPR